MSRSSASPDSQAAAGPPAVSTHELRHVYGTRTALRGVTFSVPRGEIFGLLGENGGGKTTLFKILSTLMPPTAGEARLLGHNLSADPHSVRGRLGVVFQHASLDPKLTVFENLLHQGRLYGMRGAVLKDRAREVLGRLGLDGRRKDLAGTLSGGLQRRTELAKAFLHRPEVLLLDEPGTGLDPGVRKEFDDYLVELRETEGTTVLLTTHILEEAERCDRVAFLHQGEIVAMGPPDSLKARVGGDVVAIQSPDPEGLKVRVSERFGCEPRMVHGTLRVERPKGHEFVRDVVDAFPGDIRSITFGKPTLEDVFVRLTGRGIHDEQSAGGLA
ncbi:MAG: ATP-binding cassette domain-containing protein [Nitrospinota bacterium]